MACNECQKTSEYVEVPKKKLLNLRIEILGETAYMKYPGICSHQFIKILYLLGALHCTHWM